ncbi:MAG: hypothetical protein HC794_06155 [Nitrospiraceae bacterium]|nr:hypothetical protein [Nitrospiraceae bacterium]
MSHYDDKRDLHAKKFRARRKTTLLRNSATGATAWSIASANSWAGLSVTADSLFRSPHRRNLCASAQSNGAIRGVDAKI